MNHFHFYQTHYLWSKRQNKKHDAEVWKNALFIRCTKANTSTVSAASLRSSSERAALDLLPHATWLFSVISCFLVCFWALPLLWAFLHLLTETDTHAFIRLTFIRDLTHKQKEHVQSERISALRSLAPAASSLPLPVWGRRAVSSQSVLRFAGTAPHHTCTNTMRACVIAAAKHTWRHWRVTKRDRRLRLTVWRRWWISQISLLWRCGPHDGCSPERKQIHVSTKEHHVLINNHV